MSPGRIVLYRGLMPGAFGLDVHGGYGEAWSWEFEYAKGFAHPPHGFILKAVLHPSAKRLVLVTAVDADGFSKCVPDGIRLLAEIVGDPWVYDSVMSGHEALWEVWEPEWTKAVIDAGYDSIFTGGFDAPEEYVLNANKLQFVRYYRIPARDCVEGYPIEADTLEQLGYVVGLVTAV